MDFELMVGFIVHLGGLVEFKLRINTCCGFSKRCSTIKNQNCLNFSPTRNQFIWKGPLLCWIGFNNWICSPWQKVWARWIADGADSNKFEIDRNSALTVDLDTSLHEFCSFHVTTNGDIMIVWFCNIVPALIILVTFKRQEEKARDAIQFRLWTESSEFWGFFGTALTFCMCCS